MRAFANEVKFTLSDAQADEVRAWARASLQPDPHGSGEADDTYRTTTIYLETPAFDVFHQRGSNGRAKYRIRRYGEGPVIFIERKLKWRGKVAKRRTLVTAEDLPQLTLASRNGHDGSRWFTRRLDRRLLAPVCQISYERMARMGTTPSGAIRLTMDRDVRARPAGDYAFADHAGAPVPGVPTILELKYHGDMPAVFLEVVETFKLVPEAISKYRLGATALGLVPAVVEPPAGAR